MESGRWRVLADAARTLGRRDITRAFVENAFGEVLLHIHSFIHSFIHSTCYHSN